MLGARRLNNLTQLVESAGCPKADRRILAVVATQRVGEPIRVAREGGRQPARGCVCVGRRWCL